MTKQILIIDDNDDIREVVQASLEIFAGWTVLSAASGAEGIELAAVRKPDAILLDVMMPVMDGPTTFAQLQANPATSGIPVVFLTAKAQAVDRQRYLSLGVQGLLTKPFDPLNLAQQITEILGWDTE